jgi:hypothetical protein
MTNKKEDKVKTYKKNDPNLRKVLVSINKSTYDIIEKYADAEERPVTNYVEIIIKSIFEGSRVMDIEKLIEKHRFNKFAELDRSEITEAETIDDGCGELDEVEEIMSDWEKREKNNKIS